MPINIYLLRGEDEPNGLGKAELVRESERMRGKKITRDGKEVPRVQVVDEVIKLDKDWRNQLYNMEQAKKKVQEFFFVKEMNDPRGFKLVVLGWFLSSRGLFLRFE